MNPKWAHEQHLKYHQVMLESSKGLAKDVGFMMSRELLATMCAEMVPDLKRLEQEILDDMWEDDIS